MIEPSHARRKKKLLRLTEMMFIRTSIPPIRDAWIPVTPPIAFDSAVVAAPIVETICLAESVLLFVHVAAVAAAVVVVVKACQ